MVQHDFCSNKLIYLYCTSTAWPSAPSTVCQGVPADMQKSFSLSELKDWLLTVLWLCHHYHLHHHYHHDHDREIVFDSVMYFQRPIASNAMPLYYIYIYDSIVYELQIPVIPGAFVNCT